MEGERDTLISTSGEWFAKSEVTVLLTSLTFLCVPLIIVLTDYMYNTQYIITVFFFFCYLSHNKL